MIGELFFFGFGIFATTLFFLYYIHKNELPYLLTTIKEDVVNLQVTLSNVLESVKK